MGGHCSDVHAACQHPRDVRDLAMRVAVLEALAVAFTFPISRARLAHRLSQ
jgi:hypothetical protein